MNNELFNLEFLLSLFGAFSLGYATYKGIKWLWVRKPRISFKNPLKSYIRREVINYLKEIQK